MADVTEVELLRASVAGDPASRAVYADWLEQHGRSHHAEFLRLQDRLHDPSARTRIDVLATMLDPEWRAQIEACRPPTSLGPMPLRNPPAPRLPESGPPMIAPRSPTKK